jgi:hypothetical protein
VRCLRLVICRNTAPQRLHKIDRPGHRPALFWLRRAAGLLNLQVRHQRLLIAVPESGGIEGRELAVENMFGKPEQFGCQCQLRDLSKTVFPIAHLRLIAQGRSEQALVIGLKRHHPFALGQHDAPERHQGFAAHRVADHRKGVLADRIVGGDVIGRLEEALVNVGTRHEAVDVDGVRAFDLDGLQLLVLNEEKLVLADLIAAGLLVPFDRFTGLLINELLTQPVAGLAVDLSKRNPLRG